MLGAAMAAAGCRTVARVVEPEAYIAERSRQWTVSYSSGDSTAMEQILADDFTGTSPSGRRYGKREAIKSALQGPSQFAAAALDKVHVKVFGGVALAFGDDLLTLKSGSPSQVRTRWTDTWLLRNGDWAAVSSHESVVKDDA